MVMIMIVICEVLLMLSVILIIDKCLYIQTQSKTKINDAVIMCSVLNHLVLKIFRVIYNIHKGCNSISVFATAWSSP